MTINQTYDKTIDAVYLKFSENKISKTEEIGIGIMVDRDRNGFVIGIEVLDAVKRKFKFGIIETPSRNSQKMEISAGREKVNFKIPAYV